MRSAGRRISPAGSSGSGWRRSAAKKASALAAMTARARRLSGESHPVTSACDTAKTSAATQIVMSAAARASSLRPAAPAGRVGEQQGRRGRREYADGHVDQEDGAPAGELHQDAAEHLAGDEADGSGRPVQAERPGALLAVGEAGRDQRQGGRRDDRGACALDDARGDEQHGVAREPARQRRGREDQQTEDEHPAASEQVSGPAAEDRAGRRRRSRSR